MTPARSCLVVALPVLLVSGCKSGSSSQTTPPPKMTIVLPPTPGTGDVEAFARLTNAIPVSITVGSSTGWAFVDTGNPWVLLDPTVFPSAASLPTAGGTLPSVVIASQTATNPYAIGNTGGDLQGDATFNLDANVGCSVVCGFSPSFNYRDVELTLAASGQAPPTPKNLEPAVVIPFSFEGGGLEGGLPVPKSRIVLPVSIEGLKYTMILDTGASDVTVSATVYDALVADGRTQIDGGTTQTASGSSTSAITRSASMVVGASGGPTVEVTGVIVAHDTSFDANLESVSTDVGETIDGSLGGTFLHDFFITVDYANQTVSFARYSDTSFNLDAAEHIGLTLGTNPEGNYGVASVSGSALALGIEEGDVIVRIENEELSTLTTLEIAALPFGAVGSTRAVTFGAATNNSNMTINVPVDETLPLPSADAGK